MKQLFDRIKSFVVSEDGPTTTEYAVMLALIVTICMAAISGIGSKVDSIFTTVDGGLPTGAAS